MYTRKEETYFLVFQEKAAKATFLVELKNLSNWAKNLDIRIHKEKLSSLKSQVLHLSLELQHFGKGVII